MQENFYLIFGLSGKRYGIRRACVKEVFALPAIASISDSAAGPHKLMGMVDFRGSSLPIIDLNVELGESPLNYQLTDIVIVLKCAHVQVGIIANEVFDMKTLSSERDTVQIEETQDSFNSKSNSILAGLINIEDGTLILRDPGSWIDSQQILHCLEQNAHLFSPADSGHEAESAANATAQFDPTAEAQEILRKRADTLKDVAQKQESGSLKPIAVITLGGCLWGIDLEMIREFSDIQKVTPIPCCPSHIVGNSNLRGEILTLIDIREQFNLPSQQLSSFRAMIVEIEDMTAGIVVEEVNDAMYLLRQQDITAVASHLDSDTDVQYLKGVAPYGAQTMKLLDLPQLFLKSSLVVDEAV
jgi:purine-binding chemotaxis protein CheW